jgi:hypothetical protein
MSRTPLAALLLAATLGAACYHATIETGLEPAVQTLEDPWADAWIYGLVAPETVQTAQRCPNGVARIETQQTFVNGLVGFLTFGIYTPMSIKVTCAARGGDDLPDAQDETQIQIDPDASMEEKTQALKDAAERSAELGSAVYVTF